MKRISIIVPVLNETDILVAGLQALRVYRDRHCEVIVVDGGSSDGTAELARPLADKVLVSPRGRANQMNAGAAVAEGAILLFLHIDTRLPEGADRLVRAGLASSGRAWGRFDARIDRTHPMLPTVAKLMSLRSRLTGIATGDQAIFVTREAFQSVGGFPNQILMEDIALSKALKCLSRPLCLQEKVTTSGRRWQKHGVARIILLMWWLRLRYFFGTPPDELVPRYQDARE